MSNKTGFGIVSPGSIGKVQAEAISTIPGAKLVAVCGRDARKTQEFAARFGATAYTEYAEFLTHPGLDIVSVCSPSGLHAAQGCQAARAGKHVIVEKPIEISLARADQLIETCEQSAVRLGVIFQSRFLPAAQRIRRAVETGQFGKLMMGDAYVKWYRAPEYYADSWHGTLALDGGGALINQAIHTLDLLQWMMGPAETVFALKSALRYPHIEAEDTLVGTIRFRNGALGVIEAATAVSPGFRRRLEISGERGTVILDGDAISHWSLPQNDNEGAGDEAQITDGSADPKAISSEGHRLQLEEMMRAVLENREPLVNGREGRKSLELVEALYQSANTGQPIHLPDPS